MSFKENLKQNHPGLKKAIVFCLSSMKHPRPRIWTRILVNPFFHKRGRGSKVCCRSRLDVFPWHKFEIGRNTIVEDWAVINNGAGDVIIGNNVQVGIGTVVVGPVTIGNGTGTGPYVHISGFSHGYEDFDTNWDLQGLTFRPATIGDDCMIGANVTICPGVHIGNKVQVGAGSVVTKDIPDGCVVVGNPAKVVKLYNPESGKWERVA